MKRYRIISELGKGATGVVFRAVKVDDGTTVALKKLVLPGHLDAKEEEEFIRRFKSEAKAAETLNHPGIVKALDCGLDEETLYIAYELIEGVTIDEALKSGRKFQPDEAADIIAQLADALDFAHRQGVVHRDLSPGNIFLTGDGKVRVTDFGVAGFLSKVTVTSDDTSIVGTPGYMAPEQITGSDVDPRSDIFSLGCVAYEILAGIPPFSGDNLAQIIYKVINDQPKPIRDMNPKVPIILESLVFRLIAKNPDYRYQSMSDVVVAAKSILEEIPRIAKRERGEDAGHEPVLVAVAGPHEGLKFRLLPTVTTIGRAIGDILLNKDDKVASQHAWITREETGWVLYDADTDGQTFLNGESIEREEIYASDRIKIGDTVLEFRGAGGHVGAFTESGESTEFPLIAKTTMKVPGRKFPWVTVILLVLPGILVIAGLVYIGFIVPARYLADLDGVTESRWSDAMAGLKEETPGSDLWYMEANDILNEWGNNPLFTDTETGDGAIEDYLAPAWVLQSGRINSEVSYRADLFNLTKEFLQDVTSDPAASPEGPSRVSPQTRQKVKGLIPRIELYDVPSGVGKTWEGRKNELLYVIRSWEATVSTDTSTSGETEFTQEKDDAKKALLDGYYIYEIAGKNINLLNDAFYYFESSISSMNAVLESDSADAEAKALRGLGFFLGANVLFEAGSPERTDRYERALSFLDQADYDIAGVTVEVWDGTIPDDFDDFVMSPSSLLAKSRAMRMQITELLINSTPGVSE